MAIYNGLRIREATQDEREHFLSFWKERFSGYVAVMPDAGIFCVLNNSVNNTPYDCFRINDSHTEMIHAGYSQFDCIFLEDGIAMGECLDCGDRL